MDSAAFLERLQNDPGFAAEVNDAVRAKIGDGQPDIESVRAAIAEAANDMGYEMTKQQADDLELIHSGELSEEELGKVAGGCTPLLGIGFILATLGSVFITTQAD